MVYPCQQLCKRKDGLPYLHTPSFSFISLHSEWFWGCLQKRHCENLSGRLILLYLLSSSHPDYCSIFAPNNITLPTTSDYQPIQKALQDQKRQIDCIKGDGNGLFRSISNDLCFDLCEGECDLCEGERDLCEGEDDQIIHETVIYDIRIELQPVASD